MVLSLTLPEPGNKKRIKDVIIDILSFEWPFSLSQLHNRVSKNYGCSTSCQATYKALSELLEEGVIKKDDKLYSINLQWADKIKEFALHIENNYKNEKEKIPLIEGVLNTKTENNVTVLTFSSILEMDKMWLNIKKDYYKRLISKDDVTFWEGNHCWWLLVYPEAEYGEIEALKEKKARHFFINHNDNPLDKEAKKFYEQSGIGFKTSKNKVDSDISIFGDTIMQVTLPEELKKKIDGIYLKCKSSSEVDVHEFLKEILTKKANISLILTKNKGIADQLKQNVLKEFNQKV